jgi:hypothetical protein
VKLQPFIQEPPEDPMTDDRMALVELLQKRPAALGNPHTARAAGAAHPATAETVDDGGRRAHRSAGRIPRLARQSAAQPRWVSRLADHNRR